MLGQNAGLMRAPHGGKRAKWHVEGATVTVDDATITLPDVALGAWRVPIGGRDLLCAVFGVASGVERIACLIAPRDAGLAQTGLAQIGLAVVALEPWAWPEGAVTLFMHLAGSETEAAVTLNYDVREDRQPGRRHEAWRDRLVWDARGVLRADDGRMPLDDTWQRWRSESRALVVAMLVDAQGMPGLEAMRGCGLFDPPPFR